MDVDRIGSCGILSARIIATTARMGLLIFFLALCVRQGLGQGASTIILGPIEGELEKKQIALDLGTTSQSIVPLISKAIAVHGGLRLATPKQSQVSCSFSLIDGNRISVGLSKGNPKQKVKELSADGSSLEASVLSACDRMVEALLGTPGFFSGQLCFLSNLSGKKEIFTSNSLMTSARPQTSYGKITFNPSWDNTGRGIFFTSNRKVFNNVYHLDLTSRKVSTIANCRGNNLRAVQNPRSSQIALILSTTGNPEVWLAANPQAKPQRLTRNKSNESGPSWSADGRRLIITSDSRGKPQIYEVSLSTGRLSRIATNISSHCTEASWNPKDGNRFAFTAAVGGGFQVCEYSFATRTSKILTKGPRDGMQPFWANDGRHLYFTERSASGHTRIMILDTEFDEARPIALHDSNFGSCSQVSFRYPG